MSGASTSWTLKRAGGVLLCRSVLPEQRLGCKHRPHYQHFLLSLLSSHWLQINVFRSDKIYEISMFLMLFFLFANFSYRQNRNLVPWRSLANASIFYISWIMHKQHTPTGLAWIKVAAGKNKLLSTWRYYCPTPFPHSCCCYNFRAAKLQTESSLESPPGVRWVFGIKRNNNKQCWLLKHLVEYSLSFTKKM